MAFDLVIAAVTVELVSPDAAADHVVANEAVDDIVAGASFDDISAETTESTHAGSPSTFRVVKLSVFTVSTGHVALY